jgi:uncharacterized membrane protein
MIGFAEKHRAVEVLPQLQRLTFDWSADLQSAVAVEIERDGRLRLHHSQILGHTNCSGVAQWKAILGAIVPLPHISPLSSHDAATEFRTINADGSRWLKVAPIDSDFIRNASALLRPGNSAIFTMMRESSSALAVLSGYSYIVLRASIELSKSFIDPNCL